MLRREGLLRVKEAAELLGVCPNTVRAWGAQGKILELRHPINNYRLYRRDDLEGLVQELMNPKLSEPQGRKGVES